MKLSFAALTISLAAASLVSPALAADWGNGAPDGGYVHEGIQDYQGGETVPVPAPVPIPDYKPTWYFRLDAGLGVTNDPDVGATYDFTAAQGHPTGPDFTYSAPSSWFSSDFDTFLTLGGGVGVYFGNGWRMDAQVEKRSKDDFSMVGTDEWVTYGCAPCGAWAPIDADTNTVGDSRTQIQVRENTKLDGTVWTANLYHDFHTRSDFTPYIGAGLGFAWNEISRNNTTTYSQCATDTVDDSVCDPAGAGFTPVSTATATDRADKVSLAAAAMAGFSYKVTDITSVDMGYRFLYIQGVDAVLNVGGQSTRVEIDDQYIHQLRAGLRFDVN